MKVIKERNAAALAQSVAGAIAEYINEHPGALLCFAAGETPLASFQALIGLQRQGKVDLGSVYYVGLDEWWGLGRETRGSCVQVMFDGFYDPAGIPKNHIEVFDGLAPDADAELRRIEAWIALRGGIGFTLLGIGMNGHVGFNEPGTGLPMGCIKVELDDTTKSVSKKYFDSPLPVEYGIGVGAGELKKADVLFLMADSARKAEIVKKTVVDAPTADVPSSLMTDHPHSRIYLDDAAAVLL